ncbi:serine/threonine protein kinase [Nocardia salmonicida]|uniref:serine/threonine protein kinase n=1 Tax=Nocardia salmonicida TaxID=53431 RepID=UPI0037B71B76
MSSPQQPRPKDSDTQHTHPVNSQPNYDRDVTTPPASNALPPSVYLTPQQVYTSPPHPQNPRPPAWIWALVAGLAVGLLGTIGYIWVWPMVVNDTSVDETQTVIVTPQVPQVPGLALPPSSGDEVVPGYATRCASMFPSSEFPYSAVGSNVTSCEFSEEVRFEYISQPQRGGTAILNAFSPVTSQTYTVTCSGTEVVTCTGGNNAVVYLY